jgi:hypothetical protein
MYSRVWGADCSAHGSPTWHSLPPARARSDLVRRVFAKHKHKHTFSNLGRLGAFARSDFKQEPAAQHCTEFYQGPDQTQRPNFLVQPRRDEILPPRSL